MPRAAAALPPAAAFLPAALPLPALPPAALPAGCLPSLPPLRARLPDLAGAVSAGSLRLPDTALPPLPFLAAGRGLGEALRLAPDVFAGADLGGRPALPPDAAPPFFFPEAGSGAGVAEAVRPDRRGAALGAAASSSCAGSCRPERRLSPAILLLRWWLRRPWRPAARAAGLPGVIGEVATGFKQALSGLQSNDGAGDCGGAQQGRWRNDLHPAACQTQIYRRGEQSRQLSALKRGPGPAGALAAPLRPMDRHSAHLCTQLGPRLLAERAASREVGCAALSSSVCRPLTRDSRFSGGRCCAPMICAAGWPCPPPAAHAGGHAQQGVTAVLLSSRPAAAVPPHFMVWVPWGLCPSKPLP